jgi:hypothetical protein
MDVIAFYLRTMLLVLMLLVGGILLRARSASR